MKTLREILVGVDLTPGGESITAGSRRAALQAQWLAERNGGRLTLLHSTHLDPHEHGGRPPHGREAPGARELEQLAADYTSAGTPCELVLADEPPWIALIRRVLRGRADVVVVARRNEAGGRERRLGSVSVKLIRKCPAPVWVVKPDHELVHRAILVATDLTPVGDLATEYGAYLARAHGAGLRVVHAWQVPFELQMEASRLGAEETGRRKRAIAESALRHVRDVLEASGLATGQEELHVRCDAPSHAILDEVRVLDPDLLVMGSISRGGIAGLLVGNTAEKLLSRVECSLLTVKPEDFVCPLELEP